MTTAAKRFWGIVVVIAVIVVVVFVASKGVGGRAHKIGVSLPLAGDGATYGVPLQRMIQMAADKINADGGIDGKPVEMVYENDNCNGKDAAAAAQKLINIDKVPVILGSVCSGALLGFAPIAEENHVLVMGIGASSPKIKDAGDYVFRLYPSDAMAGVVMAKYAYQKLGYKKVAIIAEQTDYAQGLSGVFKAAFEKEGGTVVVNENYPPGETDFRTIAAKVKEAGADAVYPVPQTPATGGLIMKQVRSSGITAPFLGTDVTTAPSYVKDNAKDAEGMVGVTLAFDQNQDEATKALFADYQTRFNEAPAYPNFQAIAYDATFMLRDGIKQVGWDADKLKSWLYGLKGWDGIYKGMHFDADGEPLGHKFMVQKADQGELKNVEVFTP